MILLQFKWFVNCLESCNTEGMFFFNVHKFCRILTLILPADYMRGWITYHTSVLLILWMQPQLVHVPDNILYQRIWRALSSFHIISTFVSGGVCWHILLLILSCEEMSSNDHFIHCTSSLSDCQSKGEHWRNETTKQKSSKGNW